MSDRGFLPGKGKYKTLLSYQKSVVVYDCTYCFCDRFLSKFDRTIDQMVQAARSGKQNIIEGAKASSTSAETELKLTNVARASLEELLEDYHDFLRVRNLALWQKDDNKASYIRKLSSGKIEPPAITGAALTSHDLPPIHGVLVDFIKTRPPETCANIMICLINQCNFLLDRQIKKLEEKFQQEGGLRERMYKARTEYRKKQRE